MKVSIINPPLISQKGDIFGSGIPYMPYTAAYLASSVRAHGHDVTFIDGFGEAPLQRRIHKAKYVVHGIEDKDILDLVPKDVEAICLVINLVTKHGLSLDLVAALRERFTSAQIIVIGNTLSVVGYPMAQEFPLFLDRGADYAVLGESEVSVSKILDALEGHKDPFDIDGIAFRKNGEVVCRPVRFIADLDRLPFPAWDLLPLENYWRLGYAHGPMEGPYLPLITSRGCPFRCAFCVVPSTNHQKWRSRSPENVVAEIDYMMKRFGVKEFHLEDLNPTVQKSRIIEFCKQILQAGMEIRWKLVSGTKVETLDKNVLEWMAKAGCNFISISPESGSSQLLRRMRKPFNHRLGLEMISQMRALNIKSQACFVLGFPGESDQDRLQTKKYIREIVRAGADEIAVFIVTPIPGSAISGDPWDHDNKLEDLTFSPQWREDYRKLSQFRLQLYLYSIACKLFYQPLSLGNHVVNICRRRFQTKMEMILYKLLVEWFRSVSRAVGILR